VIPENFVEKALYGDIMPIQFVTTTQSDNVVSLLKTEIAKMITDMVVASQQGAYGVGNALSDSQYPHLADGHMEAISIRYVDLVLRRNQPVQVEELGVAGGLTTVEYYLCSFLVLFIMLMGLPFVFLYCRKDNALCVLLRARGVGAFSQQTAEYLSHFLSLIFMLCVLGIVGALVLFFGKIPLSLPVSGQFLVGILLVTAMLAAWDMMIFEWFPNIISGLLFHFFSTVFLCYVSGCFYPLYSFPPSIQQVAKRLPVHLARELLGGSFTENFEMIPVAGVFVYFLLFFGAALVAKNRRLNGAKGR
jgi:ABC-2 type transport system permease protein